MTDKDKAQVQRALDNHDRIEQLVEWLLDAMDVSALESFVRENLTDYYRSDDGVDDFETNYLEMKEIVGDE